MITFISLIINLLLVLGLLLFIGYGFIYGFGFVTALMFAPLIKIKNKDYKNLWLYIMVVLSFALLLLVAFLPESN